VISDDIDGSPNAETVTFGFDGVAYEIDLAKKNREKLERAVAPYVHPGRKVSPARGREASARRSASRLDRAVVRSWANEHGMKVSKRGRISAAVLEQYEAAH